MVEKIETIDQFETHLSKHIAAYRKSYKICRSAHLSLRILAGLLGCSAVLAHVPAVPIFIATGGLSQLVKVLLKIKCNLKKRKASKKVAIAPSNNFFAKSK